MKRSTLVLLAGVSLAIPLGALLITRSLTRATCAVGGPASECGANQVCARIDARGRSLCLPEAKEAAIELGFPYEAGRQALCAQGPRNGAGDHSFINTLEAVDLKATGPAPAKVLSGLDGTAYIHTGCPEGSDPGCGWGFGNFVQVVDPTNRYLVLYAYLGGIPLRNGYPVKRGQVIGTEGETGQAVGRGRRLHWQVSELEDPRPKSETIEKPAWRTRSVAFRFAGRRGDTSAPSSPALSSRELGCGGDPAGSPPLLPAQ